MGFVNAPLARAYKRYNYTEWKYTKKQYIPHSIAMQMLGYGTDIMKEDVGNTILAIGDLSNS